MAIYVSSSALAKGLKAVLPVVVASPIVPILENVKLEWAGVQLRLTASNSQQTLSMPIEAICTDSGAVCVSAKFLSAVVAALPEQPLTLNPTGNFNLEVVCEQGRYKFDGENPIDWPKPQVLTDPQTVQLPLRLLHEAAHQTLYVTTTSDYRPATAGVLWRLEKGKFTFAATDYYRFAEYIRTDATLRRVETPIEAIVTAAALKLATKFFPDHDADALITVRLTKNLVELSDEQEHVLTARLIDEKYPDYRAGFPTGDGLGELVLERRPLLAMAQRLGNLCTSFRLILTPGRLYLATYQSIAFLSNEAYEGLDVVYDGEPVQAVWEKSHLIPALEHLPTETVRVVFKRHQFNSGPRPWANTPAMHTAQWEPQPVGEEMEAHEHLTLLLGGSVMPPLTPDCLVADIWREATERPAPVEKPQSVAALLAEAEAHLGIEAPEPPTGRASKKGVKALLADEVTA